MANENEEPQSQNCDSSKQNNQLASAVSGTTGLLEKTFENDGAEDDVRLDRPESHTSNTTQIGTEELATGAKGKLNDLVADLYTSVMSNGAAATTALSAASLGDYKNIRATAGPGNLSDTVASSSTNAPPPSHTQNTFSFKHFLSSGASTLHAPSSTVTSLDASTTYVIAAVTTTNPTYALQSSTGARPKVPQSSSFSVSATTNSILMGSLNAAGSAATESNASCTKMKRSPRFSSFDSQASLAGAAANANAEEDVASNSGCSGGFRLHPFTSSTSNTATTNCSHYERQFEPCSHYDMQMPSGSPRRRLETIEARPNRLSLAPSTKQRVRLEAHCFPGELPGDAGPNRSSVADFPAASAAAALPDFVQDHWMDSWCPDAHWLDNSTVCDFVQDLPGDRGVTSGNTAGGSDEVAEAIATSSASLDVANSVADDSDPPPQRLPDFLSDGPIIHSSQRLADVAAGLPSNLMNSPEDAALKQQLSDLRIENERQKRDLNEARSALTEQKRRSIDLERQLQELKRSDAAYKQSAVAHSAAQDQENLEQAKRRQAVAEAHVRKLKQQVKQLTTEVNCLQRENESLREEGAVGGYSSNANCDRRCAAGVAAGSVGVDGDGVGGALGNAIRPSRSQQISKDLLRAASNAENNLRQLLSGVENLRQMAADIEKADLLLEYDVSPDLFSDFLDERDDYEEYQGGPAL